jgi:hypothetical protein
MFAIREDRDHCLQEDFMKVRSSSSNQSPRRLNFILNLPCCLTQAVRKMGDAKKHETKSTCFSAELKIFTFALQSREFGVLRVVSLCVLTIASFCSQWTTRLFRCGKRKSSGMLFVPRLGEGMVCASGEPRNYLPHPPRL